MNIEKSEFNSLLESLVIFTKLYGNPYSAEALTAGLPIEDGRTTPELFSTDKAKANFSRAAARAGFISQLQKRRLEDINQLVLPCILLLKDGNSCILESFNSDRTYAKIVLPELGETFKWIKVEELNSEYVGYAIYLNKKIDYEERENSHFERKKHHWFWGTLRRSAGIYRDVILTSIMINLFVLAIPMYTMNVYDRVVPNNATETLWVLAIGVLGVILLDATLKFGRTYFLEIAGKKSDIIMSSMIFEKVLDLKMDVYPKSIGSFANNLKEFESIRSFFASSSIAAIVDLPFVVLFLLVIYYIGGSIVIIPLVVILLIIAYALIIKNPLQKSIESTYQAASVKNGILIESLSSLENLKTLGATGHSLWKWEEATGDIANKSTKSKILSTSIGTITGVLIQLNTVFIIAAGVYLIHENELSMGGLIAAVILTSRAISPMGQFASLISNYEQTKTAFETIESIMKMPQERESEKKFVARPAIFGDIEFKNVSFTYPESNKKVLDDISFKIKRGERVAIVGKIGSGKTTIQKLLTNLYTPTEGQILIDGTDISQIDPADLRKNLSYTPQDVTLFKGTVRDNIVYKAPHVDDETIIKIATLSGVKDFIDSDPMGFDKPVGERGMGLSGGQRQCIAVARSLIYDVNLIIMDEPTNSMDDSTEALFIKRFQDYLQEKTFILVTHKTSLLKLVDRLIVVDNGKILLDGDKNSILTKLSK